MNSSISHIVFLTPGFAVSENDSVTIPSLQIYLMALRKALPQAKLTLIPFQYPFTNKKYNWNGIDVIPLNGCNKKSRKIATWYTSYKLLQKIHLETPFTVIHSFWIGECSLIGQLFARQKNISHIVTAMGQDVFKNSYVKFIHEKHSKVVTLSKHHQSELYKNYGLKSEIIPWGIDTDSFPKIKDAKIDILGVGSLNSIKNYPFFIDVIKKVVEKRPDLNVEIIGSGNESSKIRSLIKSHNLNEHITLTGELSRDNVLQKMSMSKILLHTSKYESFGYVFSEALYSGMRIVSFDVGVSQKLPEWKVCNSEESFVANCLNLLSNENPEKKRVLLYDTDFTLKAYLTLYHE